MMTRVHVIAAALLGATAAMPAHAQSSAGASQTREESIVVQGQRREVAQALRKLIESADSEQLARFEDEVCPMVIGMPKDWTATLTKMIRENIVAVGGKVGKAGCTVNAPVIFIDQAHELIQALAKEEPAFFNMTPKELAQFTAAPRPISSWHVTDMRGRDGEELGSVRSIVDPNSGAHMPTDSSAKVTRNFTVGRLESPVREDMLVAFVVIDRMATPGKSLRQLADIATMHMLLDINDEGRERDPGSILSLFEARPEGAAMPARLSRFDRGALRGFYTQRHNNRTASQQASNIARAIEKGAGDEPVKR